MESWESYPAHESWVLRATTPRHFQSVARKCYVLVLAAHCFELGMRLSRKAAAAAALAAFAAAVLLLCLGRPFPARALRPTLSWGQQEVLQHARQRVSQLERHAGMHGDGAAGCCTMHGHSSPCRGGTIDGVTMKHAEGTLLLALDRCLHPPTGTSCSPWQHPYPPM